MLVPHLQHLQAFLAFSPDDVNFTCIFPLSSNQFRRCQNPINKKDRQSALLLRAEICALDPSKDSVAAYLQRYAQLCCCIRNHRPQVSDPPLIKQLSRQWKKQLCSAAISDSEEAGQIATTHANHLAAVTKDEFDEVQSPMHRDATIPRDARRAPQGATPEFSDHVTVVRERLSQDLRDSHRSFPKDAEGKGDGRTPNTRPPKTNVASLNLSQSQAESTTPADLPLRTIITRSQTGSLPWSFTPRRLPAEKTMLKLLTDPISEYSSQVGVIYLYTRWSDSGYIKLGCTTRATSVRMTEWEKSCGYKPILLYTTGPIANVRRLESLLKKDLSLQGRGRQETYCKHNKHCPKNHTEWFEISLAEALLLVDTWVAWMRDASPYRCIAKLDCRNPPAAVIREEWRRHFECLSQRKVEIRCHSLQVHARSPNIVVEHDRAAYVDSSADETAETDGNVSETNAVQRPQVQRRDNTPRKASSLRRSRDQRGDTHDEVLDRSDDNQLFDRDSLDPKVAAAFVLAASTLCKTFGVDQAAFSTMFERGRLTDSTHGVGGASSRSSAIDREPPRQVMAC